MTCIIFTFINQSSEPSCPVDEGTEILEGSMPIKTEMLQHEPRSSYSPLRDNKGAMTAQLFKEGKSKSGQKITNVRWTEKWHGFQGVFIKNRVFRTQQLLVAIDFGGAG